MFGGSLDSFWERYSLQYIGMILVAPRVICLLILVFGMLTASLFVCQMRIIQSIEPRKIVDAFGKVSGTRTKRSDWLVGIGHMTSSFQSDKSVSVKNNNLFYQLLHKWISSFF